ncbi:MAG: SCO family protein [Salinisphaeraceae bacterium]|nr:SCO family protein [Salinisphaeraceae bacterium]
MKNPVLILALAVSGGAMLLGLWSWQQWVKTTAGNQSEQWQAATVLPGARSLPEVELVNQNGAPLPTGKLQGEWHLLFFGFTHCPDICPNTLALLAAINAQRKESDQSSIQMVFVSLDPKRDTPEKIKAYVEYFDANMLGLTGTADNLDRLSKGLYLPYSLTEPDANGYYNVDHSGSLVLVDPQGQVRAYFSTPHKIDAILHDLNKLTES